MKSYFLAPIGSLNNAQIRLTEFLPGQAYPWLLKDISGDAMAYFSLLESDDTTGLPTIQVDVSGRHYDRDGEILQVLRRLQSELGGDITSAF